MNCPNCGNPVSDNATFCGSCGSSLANAQPVQNAGPVQYAEPTQYAQPVQPTYNAQPAPAGDNPYAKSALIMGIVGVALSTFCVPIVGIILGIIAIKKANYAKSVSAQLGKRPMCFVALGLGIYSIVMAAFWTIYWPLIIGVLQ